MEDESMLTRWIVQSALTALAAQAVMDAAAAGALVRHVEAARARGLSVNDPDVQAAPPSPMTIDELTVDAQFEVTARRRVDIDVSLILVQPVHRFFYGMFSSETTRHDRLTVTVKAAPLSDRPVDEQESKHA